MRIDVVTIFPGYLEPLRLSLLGRATDAGLVDLQVHDLRAWTHDRHRTVDDTPTGGGAGMVMRPEPWAEALSALLLAPRAPTDATDATDADDRPVLLFPTPSGLPFTQRDAERYARRRRLLVACGRYEGIDARVPRWAADTLAVDVEERSIGDYVLAGGEAAALVIIEAVARLLPGVLGNAASLDEESHGRRAVAEDDEAGTGLDLLEYPVYTKPREWNGRAVPEVLLSGNHAAIARWRRDQALARTAARRPDLIERLPPSALDARDREILAAVPSRERAPSDAASGPA